ncbi:unnamed protein product, partial [Ectocarpus fasciculatus]
MTTMRVLRRRAAALAVGITLVTTAAAAAAAAGRTAPASTRHRKRERRLVESIHQGGGGGVAGAAEGTASTAAASWFRGDGPEPAAAAGASSVGGVGGDGVAARGLHEELEEKPDLSTIFLWMMGMSSDLSRLPDGEVASPAADESEETTDWGLAAHKKRKWRLEIGNSDQEFADKLIAGLDGSQRQDLASKLIAELGEAVEQDLADTVLVGLEEAKDREEFATARAGAFDTAGGGGGGGELAEKLLAGLERDGEGQALAATLLVGLDATDRHELAGALIEVLRRAGQDDRAHELSAGMESARDEDEQAVVVAAAFGSVRKQVAAPGSRPAVELLENLLTGGLGKIEWPELVPGHVADEGEANVVAHGVLEKSTFPRGTAGASGARPRGKHDAASEQEVGGGGEEEERFIRDEDDANSLSTRSSPSLSFPLPGLTELPDSSKRFRGSFSSSGFADTSGLYRGGGGTEERRPEGGSGGAFSASNTFLAGEEEGIEGSAADRPGRGSPLLPLTRSRDTAERRRSAHGAVDSSSPSTSRSFGGMLGDLGDLFRGTFAGLLQSRENGSGERSSADFEEEEEEEGEDARLFGAAEWGGHSAEVRRHLSTSSDDDNENTGGNYQVEIVASTGDTSTNWNGAAYRLEVGTVVPGQTLPSSSLLAYGTINEGDTSPWTQTLNLERGCYVLFTTAGTRPYDVVWQVKI